MDEPNAAVDAEQACAKPCGRPRRPYPIPGFEVARMPDFHVLRRDMAYGGVWLPFVATPEEAAAMPVEGRA